MLFLRVLVWFLMLKGFLAQQPWQPHVDYYKCMVSCGVAYEKDKTTSQTLAVKYYYPCTNLCICKRDNKV